ncbi:hypothetical protein [Corynebacterium sp. A21]|uniref:hypothetical protein n=1 Tax=Corynebacterium sp. A21 TaxID=3457318 RepID=UPI003FD1F4CA
MPISAARIRSEFELLCSTVYHWLGGMEVAGYVVGLPEGQVFCLGLVAYTLLNACTTQQQVERLGAKLVDKAGRRDGRRFRSHLPDDGLEDSLPQRAPFVGNSFAGPPR